MKIRFLRGQLHHVNRGRPPGSNLDVEYYVEFYTQPWYRRLIYKLYHRWEMNKLVHFFAHKIERDYGTFEDGSSCTMPHCCLQAEKCFDLSRKGRTELFRVVLTKEQYDQLRRVPEE